MNKKKLYMFSHPSLGENVVKIGSTIHDIRTRAQQYLKIYLNDENLVIHFKKAIKNCKLIEKNLHIWLEDYRIEGREEEYNIDSETAKEWIKEFVDNPIIYKKIKHSNQDNKPRNIKNIPESLWRRCKVKAAKRNITISDWVREALAEKLSNS